MTIPAYRQLEIEFANHLGGYYTPDHCVAVSSGTAALHIALETTKEPSYQNVLIPEFTMIACARAATMANLDIRTIDCKDNLLLDPDLLEQSVDCDTSIIMPVHIYGRLCDMDAIHKFVNVQYRAYYVIEDMAEVGGCLPHPDSWAACWSFYNNKIIHGEEGGMIAFNLVRAASHARQLRSQGFTEDHNFLHVPRGVNARMSNLHAEPIISSLRNLNTNIFLRECLVAKYDSMIPVEWQMPDRDAPWVYDICIPFMCREEQDELITRLLANGIQARHAFKPISMQPEYVGTSNAWNTSKAYQLSTEVIYFPLSETMELADVERICNAFNEIVKEII